MREAVIFKNSVEGACARSSALNVWRSVKNLNRENNEIFLASPASKWYVQSATSGY